tara:strand:+ start:164 stop:505 length:342 start_codon:yes stop_codon:yes gene_type:complete
VVDVAILLEDKSLDIPIGVSFKLKPGDEGATAKEVFVNRPECVENLVVETGVQFIVSVFNSELRIIYMSVASDIIVVIDRDVWSIGWNQLFDSFDTEDIRGKGVKAYDFYTGV